MSEEQKERKKFYVEFEFPELPGGKMRQSWHGEATNIGMAVHHAFQDIRKRPGVTKRRIRRARVSVEEMGTSSD